MGPGAEPRRVAVFRALQLGDMLCAVPALRALRRRFPGARLTLLGLPWARAFAARFDAYIDDFLAFPGCAGLPEQPAHEERYARFVEDARLCGFDLAVQMHGDGRVTNGIVAQLGAARIAGFAEQPCGEDFLAYPALGTEIQRLLALARFLGASVESEALEFPLTAGDEAERSAFARARGLPEGECICLHPGARSVNRRWAPQNFAAVGDALHVRTGLPVVLTGSQAERDLTAAVAAAMRGPAFDAAGAISVGALAAQIARARLLVTNDTGVSHIAAALKVPSVVVFMASDMARWAPLDRALHRPVWDPGARLAGEVLAQADALI